MKSDQFKKDIERVENIILAGGCAVVSIGLCFLLNALFLI